MQIRELREEQEAASRRNSKTIERFSRTVKGEGWGWGDREQGDNKRGNYSNNNNYNSRNNDAN